MAQPSLLNPLGESAPTPAEASVRTFPIVRLMAVAMLLALAVRASYYLNLPVPLNDGGMFAQIVDELRANGLRLPTHTNYNGLNLPLSYPPLGFYLAAILGNLTGLSSPDMLKGLPLLFNVLSVGAFVGLAARVLRDYRAAICASIAFAVLPQVSNWLIMGGGLTRSPGFFFSLLAMIAGYDLLQRGKAADILKTGIFAGVAGLCHLESGTLVAVVLPLFGMSFAPFRQSFPRLIAAACVSVVVALPWVVWLGANVGFEPLRYASDTGGVQSFRGALKTTVMGLYITDKFVGLSVLLVPTLIALIARGRWLLPAWIFLTVFLVSRSAYTQVAVPAALLMGLAWSAAARWLALRWEPQRSVRKWVIPAWVSVLAILGLWTTIDKHGDGERLTALREDALASLSPSDRAAMIWVRNNTPPTARFLVLSERMKPWYMDMVGEWFPYFAQRHAILTVQGREWRPNREFRWWQYALHSSAKLPNPIQLDTLLDQFGVNYTYVFVSGPFKQPRASLVYRLNEAPNMELIHEEGNVRVYRRKIFG